MTSIRSLVFEGTLPTKIYDLTMSIPNGNMFLSSARVDLLLLTPNDYASIPKSISLEIGTVIGNDYVIDNDPEHNFFKVTLDLNIVTIGANTYLSSLTYPNTAFRINGSLDVRSVFALRDSNGNLLDPAILKYFHFHFKVV